MSTYVWTGLGSDTNWSNQNNWNKTNGGTGYPGQQNNDLAIINLNANIDVDVFPYQTQYEVEIQINSNVNLNFITSSLHIKKLIGLGGIINLTGSDIIILRNINTQTNCELSIYQNFGSHCDLLEIYDNSKVYLTGWSKQINNLEMHETSQLICSTGLHIIDSLQIFQKDNGGGKIIGQINIGNNNNILNSVLDIGTNFTFEIFGVIISPLSKEGNGILNLSGQISIENEINFNAGIVNTSNLVINSVSANPSYVITNIGCTLKGHGSIDYLNINGGTLKPLNTTGSQYIIEKNLIIGSNSKLVFTIYNLPNVDIDGKDNANISKINILETSVINNNIIYEIQLDNLTSTEIQTTPDFIWNLILSYSPNTLSYTSNNAIIYPTGFTEAKWSIYQLGDNLVLKYQDIINPLCLTENTKILTPSGYISVKNLNKGDYVITDDKRNVQIKNVYMTEFKPNKKTLPYVIHKNSISENYPSCDIKISGGHMIKYNNNWILPRITKIFKQVNSDKLIKYYHIKLENYETDNLVLEGGLIVESMGDTKDSLIIYKDRVNNASLFNKSKKLF